jgi:hypothetical protein
MSVKDQPTNLNKSAPTNFKFEMGEIPNISFFCQSVNLPSMTLGEAPQASPLIDIPLPGDKIIYGELQVEFMVDEEFRTWEEMHNWIRKTGYPKSTDEYQSILSDATLTILSNNSNPILQITFEDLYPTALGEVGFSHQEGSETLICGASFRFRSYDIIRDI